MDKDLRLMKQLLALAAVAILAACGPTDLAQDSQAEVVLTLAAAGQDLPTILVYKTSTCGCCRGWVEHLREAGFSVDARDVAGGNPELMRIKVDAGVPGQMATCHTALVDGYVVEGHVPADHIKQLVADRPNVAGIAVPGMPMGSPGMEGPNAQPYRVLSWDNNGELGVFAEVDPR